MRGREGGTMKGFRRYIVVGCTAVCLGAAVPAGAGLTCPPDSVLVGDACIDLYEASVWQLPGCPPDTIKAKCRTVVNMVQAGTANLSNLTSSAGTQLAPANTCRGPSDYGENFPATGNWTPKAGFSQPSPGVYAVSIPGVQPSACITWFQANQACRLSGKRLARNDEWQAAAQGTPTPGTDNGTTDCNVGTYPGTDSSKPVETGSRSNCKSIWGAFDMVGNMQEWVADWAERNNGGCADPGVYGFPGSDAICFRGHEEIPSQNFYPPPVPGPLTRGGEFQDGIYAGVFAVDTSFYPSEGINIIGFRCARSAQ